MKKILLFPLLNSMPSGHHQVADAVSESISYCTDQIKCKKVDLLSEWNHRIESATVKTYLKWLRVAPASYGWVYRQFACKKEERRSFKFYELLFLNKMERILESEKPDLIVCTHGFPSLLISQLKKTGKCSVPCLNIYTDFFMNDVWAKSHIDYHFVPSTDVKEQLVQKYNVSPTAVFVTGIPVSRQYVDENRVKLDTDSPVFLISGGSTGQGDILDMLNKGVVNKGIRLNVLCGTNQALYDKIEGMESDALKPFPYISSRAEMNRLYSSAAAIVTKPGGVTISEALAKELPIFVRSALPGQEEVNLRFLADKQLVFQVPEETDLMEFVSNTLRDKRKMAEHMKAVNSYRDSLELKGAGAVAEWIENALMTGKEEGSAACG